MWGDGRLKYIYFTSLHFLAHPPHRVFRVRRENMRQGLHTQLCCCYDSQCKGTNFGGNYVSFSNSFGLASVHHPHRVCRLRRFFIVSGPEKNSGKGRRAHQLHGEKFRSQREIFLSQRKNNGQYGPKKRRKPSVFGLSPLHYTNIQHFSAKSKSY